MTRIALVHAVTAAMAPVHASFAARWPTAELVNILDDSLSVDRAAKPDLEPPLARRIEALGAYALQTGADGVLFTCSAFGPAIDAVARGSDRPVLRPNAAMFAAAIAAGRRIGMLATFAPAVAPMETEFEELASDEASLRTVCVDAAMAALRAGNVDEHDRLLAEAALELASCDAVMLAHFSTARAKPAVEAAITCPVLSAPDSAVDDLRHRLAVSSGQV